MTLMARYPGHCPECGNSWQPGDLIRSQAVGAEHHEFWMHAVCPDIPSDFEHHQPVCERCWLSHAGECDR